jgi:uncharacterized membrane protein required for colicin V production
MLVEATAVVVLGLFALWGGFRGPLRQLFGLLLLAGSLWAAGTFSGRLEGLVAKVVTLEPHERCLTAWATTFLGVFVLGSVLVRFVSRVAARGGPEGFRWAGAVLGVVKGALVWVLGVYAVLIGWSAEPRPAFASDVETSSAADWTVRVAATLRRVVPLPACLAVEIDGANGRVGG